jgi:Mrp family chromosome partitioning ATPase
VVIDTPPLTAVSDAFPLLRKVDGVIIVGRVGRNSRDQAERLHHTLAGTGAPLLGVVANGFKAGRRGGYGSYDYATSGTGAKADRPPPGAKADPPPTADSPNGAVSADEPAPTAKA